MTLYRTMALACAVLMATGSVHAAGAENRWGSPVAVGFHFPGFSARASFGHFVLEGLYMRQNRAAAAGPRLYCLFNPGARIVFNAGGEYAWVNGETDVQNYHGRAVTGFLGMEVFSTRSISVGFDMGLCRVSLSGERGRTADETTVVANIGLNLYLRRERS